MPDLYTSSAVEDRTQVSCQESSSSKTRLKDECLSASLMRRVVSMSASASLKQAWSCRSQNNPAASSLGPIRRR